MGVVLQYHHLPCGAALTILMTCRLVAVAKLTRTKNSVLSLRTLLFKGWFGVLQNCLVFPLSISNIHTWYDIIMSDSLLMGIVFSCILEK